MNKQNFLCLIILTAILCFTPQKVFSSGILPEINTQTEVVLSEDDDKTYSEDDIIKRISLKNKFQKSPENQIYSFIKKYNKYSEKNNFEKLEEMYCDDFVNNDGFDKNTIFEIMKTASTAYKDIKYNTEIKEIKVNGRYATVKAHEIATAKTNLTDKMQDTGIVVSNIDYIDYLVKEGNKWKIKATEILSENVTMKYGETKNINIDIIAPECVSEGSAYDVTLNVEIPDGTFAVGSIVNEKIIFPQEDNKDIFRPIKSGQLTRVLNSNKDGYNEYTTASIALTRAQVEPPSVNINMTGMAFAMKRINIIPFIKKKELNNADSK